MDITIAPPATLVKLDLACGNTPQEGFKGVDLHAEGMEKVDLCKFPWPWADDSVDEMRCSHFIEHIDARRFEDRDRAHLGSSPVLDRFADKDLLVCFMDEAWRVLKHDATFMVVVPNARSNRGFQDPTHRRFFVAESFLYYNRDWRKANGLEHYLGQCNFAVECNPTIPVELGLLHPEAQARRFNENWNTVWDWHARMVAKKDPK